MLIVQICVGSSCHLKGSEDIVESFKALLQQYQIEDEVVLLGSFCSGQCNRRGVTIQIDDDVFPGVTREDFKSFFMENILARIHAKDE